MRVEKHSCARTLLGAAGLLVATLAGHADDSVSRSFGFVFTKYSPAIYISGDDCPDGLALTAQEAYLESVSPAERERLLKPENAQELFQSKEIFTYRSEGKDICEHVESFPSKPQKMVSGKVAIGLNLDGTSSSRGGRGTCAHQNFKSPAGEAGIDNQYYRAVGCNIQYRGKDAQALGDSILVFNRAIKIGRTTLLLLNGVDDLRNDPEVEVVVASSSDLPLLNNRNEMLPGASFTVSANQKWRQVTRGSIKDGVLTTEPIDVLLDGQYESNSLAGHNNVRDFRAARFKLTLAPDGSSFLGLMGAYQTITNVRAHIYHSGAASSTVGGLNCPGEYYAMVAAADGLPDPVTGQCTGLSIAYDVVGVTAFITDRLPSQAVLSN